MRVELAHRIHQRFEPIVEELITDAEPTVHVRQPVQLSRGHTRHVVTHQIEQRSFQHADLPGHVGIGKPARNIRTSEKCTIEGIEKRVAISIRNVLSEHTLKTFVESWVSECHSAFGQYVWDSSHPWRIVQYTDNAERYADTRMSFFSQVALCRSPILQTRGMGSILAAMILLACVPGCGSSRGEFVLPPGNADAGRYTFTVLHCNDCHSVGDIAKAQDSPVPDIAVRLGGTTTRVKSYGDLVTSIINPNHRLARGSDPTTQTASGESRMRLYNDRMTVTQLIDLVEFLRSEYDVWTPTYLPYAYH